MQAERTQTKSNRSDEQQPEKDRCSYRSDEQQRGEASLQSYQAISTHDSSSSSQCEPATLSRHRCRHLRSQKIYESSPARG